MPSNIEGDRRYSGTVTHAGDVIFKKGVTLPASVVGNAQIPASAGIDASKVNHQFPVERQIFDYGVDVADRNEVLKTVYGAAGVIVAFKALCMIAPTGGDKQFTVDLKKYAGGGVWNSVLDAVLAFDAAGTTAHVPKTAVIDTAALVAGDVLRVEVDASGSTGSQGQGLAVSLTLIETPA